MDHGHQHNLWQHISMFPSCSMDHGHQHDLWSSTDYGGLLRRPDPENVPFFILDMLSEPRQSRVWEQSMHELRAAAQHPALCNDMLSHPLQPSPSSVTTIKSLVLPLPHTCAPPSLHFSYLFFAYLFVTVAFENAVCHTVIFFPNSFTYNTHCNKSLVWFKVSSFRSAINTGPLPRLLSARQSIQICMRSRPPEAHCMTTVLAACGQC